MKDRIFISTPPGPVPLVWCNFESVPRISGVTFVKSVDWKQTVGLDYSLFLEIFRKQLPTNIPLLDITYNADCSEFFINGDKLSATDAASKISQELGISLGKNAAKKPNNAAQINDPFHIWSRNVFDGINVRKLDIDAATLTEDHQSIRTLIEVKRSKTIPVGRWLPYIAAQGNSDYWNYIISFTLCKMMRCDFVTFHHEVMDNAIEFEDGFKLDQFPFKFQTLISAETVGVFGSERNRTVLSGKDLT